MQKILLFSFSLLLFVGCQSTEKEKSELPLFNNSFFRLLEAETLCNTQGTSLKEYESYLKNGEIQIPLFKCTSSKEYKIFIGLPFNTTLKELSKTDFQPSANKIEPLKTDKKTYFYKQYSNENIYFSEFCKKIEQNLVYVLTVTENKMVADSLFGFESLSERFYQTSTK